MQSNKKSRFRVHLSSVRKGGVLGLVLLLLSIIFVTMLAMHEHWGLQTVADPGAARAKSNWPARNEQELLVKVREEEPVPVMDHTMDHTIAVLVLSRRDVFATRQVIRETWAKDHDNVFFVLGTCCPIPPVFREELTCEQSRVPSVVPSVKEKEAWDDECQAVDQRLAEEQSAHGDLILTQDADVYRHLPQKLKAAYAWALEHTEAEWLVKTDDDSVVRVDTLEQYLTTAYDAAKPVVVGFIAKGWGVHKSGKWAEFVYDKPKYPAFPVGSHGHCVSRPVASYIVEHKDTLVNYQGEDVSVGIWLDESPLRDQVQWVTSSHTASHGNCKDPNMWMIGHNIKTSTMQACFAHMDEAENGNGNDRRRKLSWLTSILPVSLRTPPLEGDQQQHL